MAHTYESVFGILTATDRLRFASVFYFEVHRYDILLFSYVASKWIERIENTGKVNRSSGHGTVAFCPDVWTPKCFGTYSTVCRCNTHHARSLFLLGRRFGFCISMLHGSRVFCPCLPCPFTCLLLLFLFFFLFLFLFLSFASGSPPALYRLAF